MVSLYTTLGLTKHRWHRNSQAGASNGNGGAATPIILLAPSASTAAAANGSNGNEFNSEGGRSVLSVAAAALDSRYGTCEPKRKKLLNDIECFLTKHNGVNNSRRPSASASLVGPAMGKRLSLAADCGREDIEAAGVAPAVAATAAGILPQGLKIFWP